MKILITIILIIVSLMTFFLLTHIEESTKNREYFNSGFSSGKSGGGFSSGKSGGRFSHHNKPNNNSSKHKNNKKDHNKNNKKPKHRHHNNYYRGSRGSGGSGGYWWWPYYWPLWSWWPFYNANSECNIARNSGRELISSGAMTFDEVNYNWNIDGYQNLCGNL